MSAPHAQCQSEPVSFLRLERYLLGELAERERAAIEAHLGACEVCRACFGELRDDKLELAPLPAGAAQRAEVVAIARARRLPLMAAVGSALALAAAGLLMRASGVEPDLPFARARTQIKGGELALALVREHAGGTAPDPHVFAAGDRFQVEVSCPPTAARTYWELVVFQSGKAFFPWSAGESLACANHVVLPGAFSLDGADPASVCVVTSERRPVARGGLSVHALPEASVCVTLTAATR